MDILEHIDTERTRRKEERDDPPAPVHILSLGAGVQSSALALMAARGEVTPMPVAAIFADTGAEPANVYRWLDWLERELPFPVHRVQQGDLATDTTAIRVRRSDGSNYWRNLIPAFSVDKRTGKGGIFRRKCTRDYKVRPIVQQARLVAGVPRRPKRARIYVVQWVGISTDEAMRMKDAPESWAQNRWPLVEMGMSRADCLRWMEAHGYPTPPRSACVFCPYHSDAEWARLKREEPDDFAAAVEFEVSLQSSAALDPSTTSVPWLHRSGVPLGDVAFNEQQTDRQIDLFNNECEGVCGV